ncbi:heat shock 90kDa protein 1 beta isoform b, partial [Reticulomyxa filosa]
IGQFGVGFYSAYLANERVVVRSKHNEDEQHVWKIIASGTFRVRDDIDNPYQIKRGTEIYLHLKDDCANFCKKKNVKKLVKKYSQFVAFQINLLTIKEEEKVLFVFYLFWIYVHTGGGKCCCFFLTRKKDDVNEDEDDDDDDKDKEEVSDYSGKKIKEKKELELLNKQKQIWSRKLEEVLNKEYDAFYKSICSDWEEKLTLKHFSTDGQLEFSRLLFVPKAPFESTKKKNKSEEKSLNEYISRMKENQKHIDYITGESRANVEASPFLEALKNIYLEVLFLLDTIYEYAVQQLREYDIKKLLCATKEDLNLPLTEEEKKKREDKVAYESLIKKMKEISGDKVEKVIINCRMVDFSLVTRMSGLRIWKEL